MENGIYVSLLKELLNIGLGGQKAPHIIKEKQRALYIAYCNLKFDIRLEHSSSEIFSTSNHHIIGYRNIIDLKPNVEDQKKILELIDDQIGNVEVGECILLSNGDLLYPLRVVMGKNTCTE